MLSAFLLSWATDDTDATDLHRFRFPFSHSYTLPLWERGSALSECVVTPTVNEEQGDGGDVNHSGRPFFHLGHTPSPFGYSPCLRGRKLDAIVTDCPSESGGEEEL